MDKPLQPSQAIKEVTEKATDNSSLKMGREYQQVQPKANAEHETHSKKCPSSAGTPDTVRTFDSSGKQASERIE